MNVVDTLSRGRRALTVWVLVTVLAFGLFIVVRVNASSSLDEHVAAAQDRAIAHAAVIGGSLEPSTGSTELAFNPRTLVIASQAEIFDDPTVARVRVYGSDAVLVFASDVDIRRGDVRPPSEDPGVSSALEGTPYRSVVDAEFTRSTVGVPGTMEELLQTFVPLRGADRFAPLGAVEVDFFMDDLRAAAINERDTALTVIAIVALLSLTGAVVTYRRTSRASTETDDVEPLSDEDAKAEVAALRTKLKTAEGRRAKAERSLEEATAELAAAKGAKERVAGLEAELAAAKAATAASEAVASEAASTAPQELEELRRQLAEVEKGSIEEISALRAELEAAERSTTDLEALRGRAEEADAKAREAQDAVTAARQEAERALADADRERQETARLREETERLRADAEHARANSERVREEAERRGPAAPNGQEGDVPASDVLRALEERIAAAEQRARDAEERTDHVAPLSEEANDLRARLAKTAARKKLGPSGVDDE